MDAFFMRMALEAAREAASRGEVPVGAVVVVGGEAIAVAGNDREATQDPAGHAELVALRRAAERLGSWRLTAATLYVTLEPCPMCAGAIVASRLGRLVYGADDAKAGAVRSLYTIADDPRLNHQAEVVRGVLAAECGRVLSDFFAFRRARKSPGQD